ncbi:MAG: FAD-dependent oxidoreductase [Planctomycetota bacterium]|jgi:selenide,water dikinase
MSEAGSRELVLVGGGHAHVHVLEHLARETPRDLALTLVVDERFAVYSGMVPGFVAGQYRQAELEIDVERLARAAGARYVSGRAVSIDAAAREIGLEDGTRLPYDVASFDIGSTVRGLDVPGVRAHALPTRPIGLFVRRVAEVVDRVRAWPVDTPFHVVVVGGGAGGVELAFTLERRLARETAAAVEVLLLERGERILSGYGASLARKVHRKAKSRGIAIRCGHEVVAAEEGALRLDGGERTPCDVLVWVTGAVCQPIFETSSLATDDRGFLLVRSTLQARDHDDLFAAGDCATLVDHPETPKAGVYAVREGPVLARNLLARLAGTSLETYTPQGDFLMLMNFGDGTAIGTKWGLSFSGKWVMRWKDRIDRRFLRRFQSGDGAPA